MDTPSFWDRLRETRLVQTLVVYLAGAWVALQVVDLFSDAFDWSTWVMRASIVVLAVGLVVTMLAVWAHGKARRSAEAETVESPRTSRPLLAGVAVVSLVLIGAALWVILRDRGRSFSPTEAVAEAAAPGVAILPFRASDRIADWREGAVDLLSISLDGLPGLRAIDNRTTLAAWRERLGEAEEADLDAALAVARTVGARWAVLGNATATGDDVILTADVYDLGDGVRELGTTSRVVGAQDSMLGLMDRLTVEILGVMTEGGVAELPPIDLARVTTSSLPALKAFLAGEAAFRSADYETAIPAYTEAVETDSTFALAHYRLGDAYGWTETLAGAHLQEHYEAAARHADRLPVRDADLLEVSLAYATFRDEATDLAGEAAERYPDDPQAQFLLGEARFHLPHQTLATPEEKREPFAEALRLDPSYVPALQHLIDLAFTRADTARVDSLMRQFRRLARGTAYDEAYGLARSMAFADSLPPVEAAARILERSEIRAAAVLNLVAHPFTYDRAYVLARTLTGAEAPGIFVAQAVPNLLFGMGRIDSLSAMIRSGALPPQGAALQIGAGALFGAPIPEDIVERYLSASGTDPADPVNAMSALLALESGERARAMEIAANARSAADSLLAAGDTLQARGLRAAANTLEGRDLMLRGRDAEALERFEASYRDAPFPVVALWAAELEEEAGRLERASRYLVQIAPLPWVGQRLGSIYERMGEPEKAREAYAWVVEGWEDADPFLQPRVVEARGALARLEGLQRG